ncbi:pentapeptide repeat-containing protein [Streptomyces sp. NPDC058613]|uniref:pentapeptide repeat-containing protein n=1 Tax=Streptomyces sp. NPDC058613 TaxID=3346556 RepID=UPI00365688A4
MGTDTTPGVASVVTGFRTAVVAIGAGIVAGTGLVLSHRSLQHTRTNDNRQAELTRGTLDLTTRSLEHAQAKDREQAELTRGTLELTTRSLEHAQARDREQAELTREGQVTDRFTKAISQLASEFDVERLGGVYALERIMGDSEKDHPTVVEVLAAFVRYHAPLPAETGNQAGVTEHQRLSEPVQAALNVLGRRPKRSEPFNIDLHRTDLRNADLDAANLASAQLWESDLRGANLRGANLYRANLFRTDLREAVLREVLITEAIMEQAFLQGTFFEEAVGLTPEQVVAAYPSSTTRLPEALTDIQEVEERIVDLETAQNPGNGEVP